MWLIRVSFFVSILCPSLFVIPTVCASLLHHLFAAFFVLICFYILFCLCKRRATFNVIHSKSLTNLYYTVVPHTPSSNGRETYKRFFILSISFNVCDCIDHIAVNNTKYQRWMNIQIKYLYTIYIAYIHSHGIATYTYIFPLLNTKVTQL